eukprot:CAMPEP_0113946888 /NCGR_PEP_ID=MMETSP1339-20121228/60859_2 /TAXON_ID=94617 /ORGANISM="Fibrocapsa japonica" /LENGTH=184 /DNA_ID=CAMNT_0000953197 /DNA_START=201 /DNA_END=755 /DNA_ORIENTATION=- /assembly_acc=CAM_ASM_000762
MPGFLFLLQLLLGTGQVHAALGQALQVQEGVDRAAVHLPVRALEDPVSLLPRRQGLLQVPGRAHALRNAVVQLCGGVGYAAPAHEPLSVAEQGGVEGAHLLVDLAQGQVGRGHVRVAHPARAAQQVHQRTQVAHRTLGGTRRPEHGGQCGVGGDGQLGVQPAELLVQGQGLHHLVQARLHVPRV